MNPESQHFSPDRATAPVALFVYNRLSHTKRTVESLQGNDLAPETDLFIFADEFGSELQHKSVRNVRDYIRQIRGFRSVTIVERNTNFGLARSIIEGVTAVVNKYGRIIVLEDDMVTSPCFLTYMNEALEMYGDNDRVISIHGYVYPVEQPLPDVFFLPGADCWGWATWKRGWACFNGDGQFLLDELNRRKLTDAFDFNGAYPYTKMLKNQIAGKNDSWAIRWHASAFLAGKLTLYPGRSLVDNIGNDNSGTHCGESTELEVELSSQRVNLDNIAIESSKEGMQAFEAFLRRRLRLVGIIRRVTRKAMAIAKGRK